MTKKTTLKKCYIATLIITVFTLQSCTKSKAPDETAIDKKNYLAEKNEVETMVLKNQSFQKELVSNGKIIAAQKNSVQFEVSDKLEHLYVKNGDFVQKGQLLASLNAFKSQQKLARAEKIIIIMLSKSHT